MAEQNKPLNLHMKLVEVRKSIDGFTKDQKGYNYSYISGTQVLAKIKQKMDELYLLLYPAINTQEFQGFPYKDKFGKDKHDFLVHGDMSYKWVNAEKPDEEIIIPWKYTGQQADISQAFGSGLTYSERYFLLKFFGVPTDDDDPDKKTYDKQDNKNKGGQQQSQPQNNNYSNNNNTNKPASNNNNTFKPITDGQKKAVNAAVNEFAKLSEKTSGDVLAAVENTSIGKFGDVKAMSAGQASNTIALVNKWIKDKKAAQGGAQ